MSNIDPIDKMLQGEETPSVSSTGEGQQDDSIQGKPIEQQTEEEVEFSKLSGSAQDRFKEMFKRARSAEERLQVVEQGRTYVPPAPNTMAPDQEQAIETLSRFGIATDKKVDEKVNQGLNQIKYDLRIQNLENKYTGVNGEPKFDRDEVEDFVRTHPQYSYYDPEDVFKFKMHPDEFEALKTQDKPRTQSLRPTKTYQRQDAITPENVEELVANHDQQWYEDHLTEINRAVSAHTNQFKGKNFGGQ